MALLKTTLISAGLLTLAACGTVPHETGALDGLPKWVTSPEVEGGIAESACVSFSGTMNVDRSEAIHLASEQLAAQLERKTAFLAKSFQSKTKTTEGLNVGTNFTQTGQQLVEQNLSGVKAQEMGVFKVAGTDQLCVMVAIESGKTKTIYQTLKTASKAQLNAKDDGVIYEQFRAYKADQELQKAMK